MVSLDIIAGLLVVLIIIVLYDIVLHFNFSKKLFSLYSEKWLDKSEIPTSSFVGDTIKNLKQEREQEKAANRSFLEVEDFGLPKIALIGCGGAGDNIVNNFYNMNIAGVETIAINTDKMHLENISADKKILIGKSITRGFGAGGVPEVGKRSAELARGTIADILKHTDLVFVTAGIGGGTGTGAAPVVAEIAKEQGAIVIGVVTSPFRVERARAIKAEEGLEELRQKADTVIVLDNNRLLDNSPNLPIDQAFSVMDELISETVKAISETIMQPSLINLDYADIKTILGGGGLSVMLVGEAKGLDKEKEVVREALEHSFLDVDIKGATGCILHITGGPDMSLKDAENIASSLTYELDNHANVIWGASIKNDYEGKVRCIAIFNGIPKKSILMNEKIESTSIGPVHD